MAETQNSEQPKAAGPEGGAPAEQKEGVSVEKPSVATEKPAQKPQPTPPVPTAPAPAAAAPAPQVPKSETLEKIEDIMEEDLESVYKTMPPEVKREFREKGEEAAVEIEGMLFKVKVHSKKVFKLLFGWLKIIPGINRYFLKQEAKLKTDEILHLKEEIDQGRAVDDSKK